MSPDLSHRSDSDGSMGKRTAYPRPSARRQYRHPLAKGLLALCAFGGVAFAGSFAGSPVAHAAIAKTSNPRITNFRSGPVYVNGQLWRNVPYFVAQNTTFVGIWYLQQLLQSYGYTTRWNGHSLFLPALPSVYNASVTVNGTGVQTSGTVVYGGTTYIDAGSVLAALGGLATFTNSTKTLNLSMNKDDAPSSSPGQASESSGQAPPSPEQPSDSQAYSSIPSDTGLISASSSQVTAEEHALKPMNGAVWEGSGLWHTAPIIVHQNTSFFGVWYLQELLREHGIAADWNGKGLSVQGMPQLVTGAKIISTSAEGTSSTMSASLMNWEGKTYMPVSALQTLGIRAAVDNVTHDVSMSTRPNQMQVSGLLQLGNESATSGDVAFQDFSGAVTVLSSALGGFSGYVPTDGATVIGVRTNLTGWIGEVLPVSSSNAANLQLTALQQMTTVSGKVVYAGAPGTFSGASAGASSATAGASVGASYHATEVSLRNVITHAHYYATVNADGSFNLSVPVGSYEVFALSTNSGDAVFLLQPFLAGPGPVSLTVNAGALPSGSQLSTAHADIITADSQVSASEVASVANMFERVYQETVNSMGVTPTEKMEIHLYGSAASYQQHYENEGYSKSEAQAIAEQSVASEEGSDTINVLMPTFDTVDGLNILSHEFTHALVNRLSTTIPSWANEGVAWTQGVDAETDNSPSTLLKQGIQWDQWVDIVANQQQGTLIALGQGDTLNPSYNVEAQDYFAVQQLIAKYGWDKFLTYVKAMDKDTNAFQDTFGESFSAFSQDVTSVLAKDASSSDKGITARVRTMPNGPTQMYVINPNGGRYLIRGLEPNTTYDVTLHADGSIDAVSVNDSADASSSSGAGSASASSSDGLTITKASSIPVAISGDWFLGSGADGEGTRQEFDIADEFGLPFVDQAILYDSDGNVNHVYPATAVPNGISLVSLTPIN